MKKLLAVLLTTYSLSLIPLSAQYKYTILHQFNDTSGSSPNGSLVISGANLYGMASAGGANGVGCIFAVDTNGNGYTDLFDFNTSNGANPNADLLISGTTMFGMTPYGGAHGAGCLFSIQTNGSGYTDLLDFDTINGAMPLGDVIISGTTLYGMTSQGGNSGAGRIFSIQTNGSGYTDLLDFNTTNGANPYGTLLLSGNTLFGTTFNGGLHSTGVIFSINTNGSSYVDLHDFGMLGGNPASSSCLLLYYNSLYGSANSGCNGFGSIFKIDTGTYTYTDIECENNCGNNYPLCSLVLADSLLWGLIATPNCAATYWGGAFADDTTGARVIHIGFDNTMGEYPDGSLMAYAHSLYGTAYTGDSTNYYGVVFKLTDTLATLTSTTNRMASPFQITVYPNPSTGIFTFQSPEVQTQNFASVQASVEVYNVLGEKVYSSLISHHSSLIVDLRSKPNGVYFYRVKGEDGGLIGEGKIVIQK